MGKQVNKDYCDGCSRNFQYSTCKPLPEYGEYITLPDDCQKHKQEMGKYGNILEEQRHNCLAE